ncbi:MAG: hypothetical protein WC297_00055 [Candidatus Paceibacterota bacterium]|jgi:hypothetical protein
MISGITDNKAIHELRDELRDLNKNLKKANKENKRLTILVIIIALVQFTTSLFQFLVGIISLSPSEIWLGIILEVLLFLFIYKIIKESSLFLKEDKQKRKN